MEDVEHLIQAIKKHPKFDKNKTVIYAVPRGGLAVASLVAYALDVKTVKTLHPQDKIKVTTTKKDFIIDSLYDTGKTYYDLHERYPHLSYAVLYCKRAKPPKDVIYGCQYMDGSWLVFPWEIGETDALHQSGRP